MCLASTAFCTRGVGTLIVRCYLQLCKQCFYAALESEVHETIVKNKLFKPGERIAVAASGMITGFPNFCLLSQLLMCSRSTAYSL